MQKMTANEVKVAYRFDIRDFSGAYLVGANLRDVTMNWQSPELIGERLRQASGDNYQYMALAGAIACNPQHCWGYWLNNSDIPADTKRWALDTMRTWVKEGDNAPEILIGQSWLTE